MKCNLMDITKYGFIVMHRLSKYCILLFRTDSLIPTMNGFPGRKVHICVISYPEINATSRLFCVGILLRIV